MENPQEEEQLYLSQEEIRHMNSEFNFKHYGCFYEKIDEIMQQYTNEIMNTGGNKEGAQPSDGEGA